MIGCNISSLINIYKLDIIGLCYDRTKKRAYTRLFCMFIKRT
ncbi:hypothetical protein [Campylobacter phage CP81]|uniref:Uncharacterized protein n=1 Tax=Campylobacter phage CP81 TaxID=2927008 RepID=G0LWH5_9CAUD|nr:hypothetical protein FDJ37_gp134 [Campylobacter phage CP81]CBZ42348.1 hypothetical protein [Campylobacter phage CP81]